MPSETQQREPFTILNAPHRPADPDQWNRPSDAAQECDASAESSGTPASASAPTTATDDEGLIGDVQST